MTKVPFAHAALETETGPGALTLAWGAFFTGLILLAAFIQFNDWSSGEKTGLTLSLDREPERFARPGADAVPPATEEPAAATGLAASAGSPPDQSAAQPLPIVRAARPGEFDDDTAAAASPQADTLGAGNLAATTGDAGAAVIRVTDLPRPGEQGNTAAAGRIVRTAGAPPAAPDPALYRTTGNGPFPRIAEDGRRPARAYARSYAATEGAPRLGLIISGLGLSREMTASAIDTLPPEATLAFAPYTKDIAGFAERARNAGHETMIELPMEAAGAAADGLGPAALMTGQSTQDNIRRLDWMLTRYAGYFGVTTYLGGAFAANEQALAPVLARLKAAGVAYVSDTPLAGTAGTSGLSHRRTDYLLSGSDEDLPARLAEIEKAASERGAVLAKIYVSPDALPEIAAWANGLKDRGIAIAPASALLQ